MLNKFLQSEFLPRHMVSVAGGTSFGIFQLELKELPVEYNCGLLFNAKIFECLFIALYQFCIEFNLLLVCRNLALILDFLLEG